MSSGFAPAFAAASRICDTDHEPRYIVPIFPVPSITLDWSQLVVVGSSSESFCSTTEYTRLSMVYRSLPDVQGCAVVASLSLAPSSQDGEPIASVHCRSGQPSW